MQGRNSTDLDRKTNTRIGRKTKTRIRSPRAVPPRAVSSRFPSPSRTQRGRVTRATSARTNRRTRRGLEIETEKKRSTRRRRAADGRRRRR